MTVDYNNQAQLWSGDEKKHHSDFVGRPELIEIVREINPSSVLDIGCGAGYLTRQIASIADRVVGFDSSEGMIMSAILREKQLNQGIQYKIGDVREPFPIGTGEFDLTVGAYIVNYIKPEDLPHFYQQIARVLNSQGNFALLTCHPCFELSTNFGDAFNYEIGDNYDYWGSRGELFKANLKTVQGKTLEAGFVHSTLEDHFDAMSSTDLIIVKLKELRFPEEVAKEYPIFKDAVGKCTSMILVGRK